MTGDGTPYRVNPQPEALGLVAGGGGLPRRVAAACRDAGRPLVLVGLVGHARPEDWPDPDLPQVWIRLGRAGEAVDFLRAHGVRRLCLAGAVRRPSLLSLWPDWRTAAFLARVGAQALGDDRLLSAILAALEAEGFAIEPPHAVIGGGLAPAGVLGRVRPDPQGWRDLAQAFQVARAIGGLDIGQGAVVQQGLVLAVEAAEGTDSMLARCTDLARAGPGGVLVKAVKPGQDRRVDLPSIGPETLRRAHAAGLRGVGVEAGGSNLIDAAGTIARADDLGLFLVGLTPDLLPAAAGFAEDAAKP